MVTREEIEAGRSPKGGFTKEQLAKWGVPWPPPQGWMEALLAGKSMQEAGLPSLETSPINPAISAHDLLRQVVLAVINAGQGHVLNEYPDVLAYFGGRNPSTEERAAAGLTEPLVITPLERAAISDVMRCGIAYDEGPGDEGWHSGKVQRAIEIVEGMLRRLPVPGSR